ncbi:MAG: hypothetical protein EOM87_08555 [Clostridia bacterium]|nr:hypothetical protein [Clostridia bacterium]
MSFSNNVRPERTPGPIMGNPINGLNERVCIEVKKVFDACIKQETLAGEIISLTATIPPRVCTPFKFLSARSVTTKGEIENLVVQPIADKPGCARVSCDIKIPLQVCFTDAACITAVGESCITIHKDIILHIPEASVIPYEIEAVCNAVSTIGTYVADATFSVTLCVAIIIKVITDVELLVPSYGYCFIPPCQEFQEEVCEGFFDLPLFPSDKPIC